MSQTTEAKRRDDAAYLAHRREQLQRTAQIPFAQKLQWLEDAHRLVLQIEAQRTNNTSASTCIEQNEPNLENREPNEA